MKITFTLLFILTLISTALAGVRIEVHNDYTHEEASVTKHSHEHSSKDEKKDDCPHLHIHCKSLCLGVLLTHNYGPGPLSYDSKEISFSLQKLSPQGFANSLYRPPIV